MTSHQIFDLLLAQTWQVAVLAISVWIIVRLYGRNRPHLAHCLWSLVLLKCLTPPVLTSPVGLFCWINAQSTQLVSIHWTSLWNHSPPQPLIETPIGSDLRVRIIDTTDSHVRHSQPIQHRSLISNDPHRTPVIEQGKRWVVTIWLLGCGVSLFIAVLRLHFFWRFVQRSSHPRRDSGSNAMMEELVQRLSRALQVSRRVRVVVIDALVGPAVFGLVRPTILLPAAIVDGRTHAELEPLVAHELIHVRRGDLWWAFVQVLASCLFWFHPLVWLAQAMLKREAEHSCDEETIAGLNCSPAMYAKSLLEVLESKHRLHSVPALPGVRPVDVTRNRLERIMSLGQGCQPSTPTWVWLLFFCSLAVVLPGGAWLRAQEGKPNDRLPTESSGDVEQVKSPVPALPMADGAWVETWQQESVFVGDLLDKLESLHGDRDTARSVLLSHIPQRSIQAIHSEGNVTISRLPAFSIEGNDLQLFETREQIAVVKQAIEGLRRNGFDRVKIQVRALTVSIEHLDKLELPWEEAVEPTNDFVSKILPMPTFEEMQANVELPIIPAASSPVPAESATVVNTTQLRPKRTVEQEEAFVVPRAMENSAMPIPGSMVAEPVATHCAVLDNQHASEIMALAASSNSTIFDPSLTFRNGCYGQIAFGTPVSTLPKIASLDKPVPMELKPKLGFSGFSLTALPLIESNADGSGLNSIDLSLVADFREVTRLDKFYVSGSQADEIEGEAAGTIIKLPYLEVEQPSVEVKRLAARYKLQSGESLLVSSRQPLAPESGGKLFVIVLTCEVQPAVKGRNHGG